VNRSRRWVSLGLVALAAVALVVGCGSNAQQTVLKDAVYAKTVPVFRGATFDQEMGDESWGDGADSYTKGTTWWFKTKAPKAELLAYYTKLYPNAERTELDSGDTQLRITPAGALKYEDVTIVIGEGELRIGESVSPNTLKKVRPTS